MKFKFFLAAFVVLLSFNSKGIVVRHDKASGDYEILSSEFPAVFFLERQGIRRVCAATVIDRQWAITAAHCVNETTLGNTIDNGRRFAVDVANETREIDAVIYHPEISDKANPEIDLALLRFRNPSAIPRPIQLYTGQEESGAVATLVGWGYFGLGTTGRQYDNGKKRRAQNRITRVDDRIRMIFDDPRIRESESLALEGTLGLGDSGGPAFIEEEFGMQLAGVAIGEVNGENYSEETQGQYGSIAIYERISIHVDWIKAVIGADS